MSIKLIAAFVPYITIGIGLLVLHNVWVAIIAFHAGIIAVIVLSKSPVPFKYLIQTSNLRWLIFSVAIGAGGGMLLYFLWPLLSVPPNISIYLESIGLTATAWPYFIAYYVLINPFFEEYYWRGYLGSSAQTPVLNDLLFAGYHLVVLAGKVGVLWLAVFFIILCGAAWYWRQISRLTGGLLAAVVSHMAADITVILTIYFLTTTS